MRRTLLYIIALVLTIAAAGQTLNVTVGNVVYQFPASQTGEMTYADGTTLTIMGKTFSLADIDAMTVDNTVVTDNLVRVEYATSSATVYVAGNVAQYVEPSVSDAHVVIDQLNTAAVDSNEVTYQLSGETPDGSLTLSGSYRCTVSLAGVTLTNPDGAALNITNKKRIQLSAKENTVNTLTDGAGGPQKACIYSKGQLQLQGRGTLNVISNTSHAIKSASYITVKNLTLNISSAAGDGINCEEYFFMKSGAVTISGVSDDGIQCDLGDAANPTGEIAEDEASGIDAHQDEDSGNIYLEGGTLNITATADAAKGLKAAGDVKISSIELTVTQTGGITTTGDLSYPTSIKAGGNIDITGGTITVNNTADGGKGISADGAITIDESNATTVINVTANGKGGSATITEGDDDGDDDDDTPPSSYVVYVTLPTSGGGMGPGGGSNAWTTLYLYKSDGTLVQQLTATVNKTSGSSTVKFYYYDFGASSTDTYYFKSADYTSRGGFGGGSGTTYSIVSETFSGPTSGSDYYYSISNSYTTSGSTRTYKISNVTNTYSSSSSDTSDDGIGYNAMGIKADGNLTIAGGNVTVKNSGAMSKSLKSKATLTINGGNISLTPSGAMQVISGDASYSSGVKCVDFVQNDGSLTITASGTAGKGISATNITTNGGTLKINNSGAAQSASSGDYYTAKGMKADGYMKLLAGTVTVTMSGNGGKGIKVNGAYTQGSSGGDGPTLTVATTGSAAGSSSSSGWGGMGGSLSGTPKGIKVVGTIYIYGGTSEVSTKNNGGEGLESKTAVYIEGGKHYFACYDDCINSSGKIYFNGGYTVCYSNGNDAVDSNAGQSGAITIGNGAVFAYTTKGSPEEGLDCDNNSYIQITGTGYAISAGASQGGGGGWGGSSSTISNAKQGYYFCTSSVSYASGRYYTLADASGNNLVTYSFPASCSSTLALFTAKGMVKGSSYNVKYSTSEPTDATMAWHGLYIGSSHEGSSSVVSFTAQ